MRSNFLPYSQMTLQASALEIDVDAPGASNLQLRIRQQGGGSGGGSYVLDPERIRTALMRRAVIGMVSSTMAAAFILSTVPHLSSPFAGLCAWIGGLMVFVAARHARDHYRLRGGDLPVLAWLSVPSQWLLPSITGGLVDAYHYLRQRLFPAKAGTLRLTHEPTSTIDFGGNSHV